MKITANGIEMNYELSGQGECLVLVHGLTDNLKMWYNQVPEFEKHCQVLTYDVRGSARRIRVGTIQFPLCRRPLALATRLASDPHGFSGTPWGAGSGSIRPQPSEMTKGLVFANSA